MTDTSGERSIASIRAEHITKIRQYVDTLDDHIKCVQSKLSHGKPIESAAFDARIIMNNAHNLVTRISILKGMADAAGILNHTEPSNRNAEQ
jgi:hypothetical protein